MIKTYIVWYSKPTDPHKWFEKIVNHLSCKDAVLSIRDKNPTCIIRGAMVFEKRYRKEPTTLWVNTKQYIRFVLRYLQAIFGTKPSLPTTNQQIDLK